MYRTITVKRTYTQITVTTTTKTTTTRNYHKSRQNHKTREHFDKLQNTPIFAPYPGLVELWAADDNFSAQHLLCFFTV